MNWNLEESNSSYPLECEHFFNKLYVAATRAINFLFVLDTDKGNKQLWNTFNTILDNTAWDPGTMASLDPGRVDNVTEMEETHPLVIARSLEESGIEKEAPELLRRAMQYYSSAGEVDDAKKCEGWALKFEGKLEQAGRKFEELNQWSLAWRVYWEGCLWHRIIEWEKKRRIKKNFTQELSVKIAEFIQSDRADLDALATFVSCLEQSFEKGQYGNPYSRQWNEILAVLQDRISYLIDKLDDPERFARCLLTLKGKGHVVDPVQIGKLYFYAENFREAKNYFETSNYTGREYQIALAEIDFSEDRVKQGLERLLRHGVYDMVMEKGSNYEDGEIKFLVSQALFEKGNYQQAIDYLLSIVDSEQEISRKKDCLAFIGKCYEALPDKEKAYKIYRQVKNYKKAIELARELQLDPRDIKSLEAEEAMDSEDFEVATTIYREIGDFEKESFAQGCLRKSRGMYSEALDLFIKAKALDKMWECILELDKYTDLEQRYAHILKFLKGIAEIDFEIEIPKYQRDRIMEWVKEILEIEDWEEQISPECIGIIYEKYSNFRDAALHYKNYYRDQQWARDGWVRAKRAQREYHLERGEGADMEIAKKIEKDIEKKLREWSSSPEIIFKGDNK